MPLEDLNEAIYKRDFEAPSRSTIRPAEAGVESQRAVPPTVSSWAGLASTPNDTSNKGLLLAERQKKRRRMIVGATGALFLTLGFAVWFNRHFMLYDASQVMFSVTSPEIVTAGETATLAFTYANGNWTDLTNAEILVRYPESFRPQPQTGWEIARNQARYVVGTIGDRSQGQIELSGIVQALDSKFVHFQAILRLSPAGITNPTDFASETVVALNTSLVSVQVTAPSSVLLGQSVEYLVDYQNKSETTLENLRLLATLPDGFVSEHFAPRPFRDDKWWLLGTLGPHESGRISIKGVMRGEENDARRVFVQVGRELGDGSFVSLAQEEKFTRVVAPPLSVNLLINNAREGVIYAGDDLSGKVMFENRGTTGLRNILATVVLDETAVDLATLVMPAGATYDRTRHTITFRASEIPELQSLEPGERGEISFNIRTRADLPRSSQSNREVRVVASLDSPDLPHGQNTDVFFPKSEVALKVGTQVTVGYQVFYIDREFTNTGPYPPVAGETTTYVVRLSAFSDANPLNEGHLSLQFPGAVRVLNVLEGDRTTTDYNERTGEFVWRIGTVGRGESGMKRLTLQVALTPSPGILPQGLNIVNFGQFSAKDSFTGVDIKKSLLALSSDAANAGEARY